MKQIALSRAALPLLPAWVAKPAYDPVSLKPGIVHLGVGAFHRAHMARFTHDLHNKSTDTSGWGIVGAGLMSADRRLHDALKAQDGLYTLVERDQKREAVTVIGAITDVIYAAEDSSALLNVVDRSSVRIVSLTVTENGYCLNPANKRLDLQHQAIVHDLVNPQRPCTPIGVISEALHRRKLQGREAFTALSCDNIQLNGDVLKQAVLDLSHRRDPALARWIEDNGRFPSTMVDRITPVTEPEDVADLATQHGIADLWPVFCETFAQWVVEDDFAQDRPAWERVGVQFVSDVVPYELMKLRLLNASHLAIAGLGRLIGHKLIGEAVGDAPLRAYAKALMDRELAPTLLPVPGIDLDKYKDTVIERFANPLIKDTVERVNTDAPINMLVDPLRDRLQRGDTVDLLALGLAAWLRRMRGTDETGKSILVRHPMAELLRAKAIEGGVDPRVMLRVKSLFGDLAQCERLVDVVGKWLESLYTTGAKATLLRAARELDF